MTLKQKAGTTKTGKKRRFLLKWWQKLLLIVGTTGLAVLGAWLYCEKIATPRYVDTVRTTLTITDTETLKTSENSDFTVLEMKVLNPFREHVDTTTVTSSESTQTRRTGRRKTQDTPAESNKGKLYTTIVSRLTEQDLVAEDDTNRIISMYKEVSESDENDLQAKITIKIQNLVSYTKQEEETRIDEKTGEPFIDETTGEPIRYPVTRYYTFSLDQDTLKTLVQFTTEELGQMIFGAEPDFEQASVTYAIPRIDADGYELKENDQPVMERYAAIPEDAESDIWYIEYHVSKSAIDALENHDNFYALDIDLRDGILRKFDDATYADIAARAGLEDVSVGELRKRISFPVNVTYDETKLPVDVTWNSADRETAERIGAVTAQKAAEVIYGREDLTYEYTVGQPVTVSEGIREWPSTLPTVLLIGIAALLLSFFLFSQQSFFDSLVVVFFTLFTLICVFPFYYLFINTISDNSMVASGQINFLPRGIHLKNYQRIIGEGDLGNALLVTVARTVFGTALMVLTSAWAGYLVTKRKMWRRSFWYRALVITMYFNAGLIPWYTNMLMLGLTGNFLAYIIPGMVAPYNIILVKTYIESIPGSLEESAIIDGASTFKVFLRIILPLSIPILATIAIFGAVGNWNSFQDSLLLMSSTPHLFTLQHRLYIYLNQTTSINTEQISEQMAQNLLNNGVTTKYTIAMITIIPILLVYPIMQRYFVKGIMLGAVKG